MNYHPDPEEAIADCQGDFYARVFTCPLPECNCLFARNLGMTQEEVDIRDYEESLG